MANSDRSIEQMIDLLSAGSREQQKEAAELLGRRGTSAVTPLLHVLQQENVGTLPAYWAVDALVRIGLPAVDSLLLLLTEGNYPARVAAIDALGQIGDERALAPLLHLLGAEDWLVRGHVAEALGKLGDGRAIESLITRLADPDAVVRDQVREAILALGEPSVLPLIRTLEDNERAPAVQAKAAALLGKIGDDRALVPLMSVLVDATAPAVVRTGAVAGLSDIDSASALDSLLHVLRSRDTGRSVRLSVARNLRDRRAFKPLLGLLRATDDDEQVRATVTKRLCWFGGDQAIDPLLGALDDPSLQVREAALWALAECGDARVFPALERAGSREPLLVPHIHLVSGAIKRRLGLPLTAEEDPVGPLIARYGRLTVHAPKRGHSPVAQGRKTYVVRLRDDQGHIDLDKPIPLVPEDRADILRVVRAQLQYTRNAVLTRMNRLQGSADSIDEARIRQEVARLERQGRALALTLSELEDQERLS